ncbi:MAG: YerC/YecD family TrpR-related protein [Clostridia bacterium]|nr:YerC/YecD family TrpR-related protein [Clostridia bacterium]
MEKLHSENIDTLFKAILSLDTVEECYSFFRDLCTVKEVKDMAQRMQVALLLSEGKNYQEINEMTQVSTATISRVKNALEYGSDGYKIAIENLKEKTE